jgi:hypothetical protein
MKKLSILLLSVLTVACVTGHNPTYYFNEIQVVNLSGATISKVNLRFSGSDKTLSCDEVAKNTLCHDRFNKLRYPQQVIDLSWTHGDGSEKSQQLMPAIRAYFSTVFGLRVMLEINEDGSVKAYYKQDEPGGSMFDY